MQKEDDFVCIHIHGINSMQFKMSRVTKNSTIGVLKSMYGEYIFLECTQENLKEREKEEILDVMLRKKVSHHNNNYYFEYTCMTLCKLAKCSCYFLGVYRMDTCHLAPMHKVSLAKKSKIILIEFLH